VRSNPAGYKVVALKKKIGMGIFLKKLICSPWPGPTFYDCEITFKITNVPHKKH
jgi:hypothetical protein